MYRKAIHTTEFWVTLLAGVGAWILTWQANLPVQYAVYASAASAIAYTISRTIQKQNADLRRGWRTTEFWLSIAAGAAAGLATLSDNLHIAPLAGVATALVGVITIARAVAKPSMDPVEPSPWDGVPVDTPPSDEGNDSPPKK